MQTLIRDYLVQHWNADAAEKVQFSPVPKGQAGDLALSFFELMKSPLAKGGLGDLKSPVQIAKSVQTVLQDCDIIEKTELSGPYLNLFFANKVFFQHVLEAPVQTDFLKGRHICVEYSGPNTNKPLHLGHMRNHALGIALCNLFEAAGATVYRVNIINDKGLALTKSMLAYDRFGEGKTPEDTGQKSDHFAGDFYVRYDTEAKKDPSLEQELPEIMRQWEAGDEKWQSLWKQLTDWVIAGVEQTYERQGVRFDKAYRESEHYERGREFAYEGLEKGVFEKQPDGAIVIDLSEHDMGQKVVLRADGTAIYLTQDLSLWPLRREDFGHIDEMIHVVGDEQNYYFQTVFHSLEKLGLAGNTEFLHYGYGLVNLPEGRMKSREGTVVDADNLMDELSAMAVIEIEERHPDMTDQQTHEIAEQIMNAAWKFYLLSTNARKTITFDPKKSIAFEGATGPYLQYAGVRLRSIFRKAPQPAGQTGPSDLREENGTKSSPPVKGELEGVLGTPEKPLGVKLLAWSEVINRAADTKNPTYIVTYLLELAQAWSSYYAENSVLNAETPELVQARLQLAHKVYDVLEAGLAVLGIEIPEKM